jgi:sugar phosphate isomerase/epimerase
MGFDMVDIGVGEDFPVKPSQILEAPEKTGREIREACARYGLKPTEFFICSVVIQDGSRVQPNDPDPARRSAMLEAFRLVCACAGEAGFFNVMGVPGEPRCNHAPDSGMSVSLDTLSIMEEIARNSGIRFTIEPHKGSLIDNPDAVLLMLEKLPHLALTLDYSHFVSVGFKPEDCFPLHARSIHIHAKPARKGVSFCQFYEGEDFFSPMLEELKRIKWEGAIAVECMYPLPSLGLLDHPACQTLLLAGHLEKILRRLNGPGGSY